MGKEWGGVWTRFVTVNAAFIVSKSIKKYLFRLSQVVRFAALLSGRPAAAVAARSFH